MTPPMPNVSTTDDGNVEYSAPRDRDQGRESSRVEIEKTKNGGFTARKFYKSTGKSDLGYMEPETYAFSSFAELSTFLSEALGGGAAAEPAGDDMPDVETQT